MNDTAKTTLGIPFDLEGHVNYADGAVVSKTVLQKETGTITLFAFDAGQGLSEHTAPFDATVVILDGKADITIGGQRHEVAAGQMLIMPANIPHALDASQRFKMMLVMIREGMKVKPEMP